MSWLSFKARKVVRAFLRRGFFVLREGSNHTIIRRESDGLQIIVPRHSDIKRGTVRGMAGDASIPWEEFKREVS